MGKITDYLASPFRRIFVFFGGKGNRFGRVRFFVLLILIVGFLAGFLNYPKPWDKSADWLNAKKNKIKFVQKLPNIPQFTKQFQFKLGLDLVGGTHLVYEADLSQLKPEDYSRAMDGVRDVIEWRVNQYGTSEPVVQIDKVANHYRLIVELAGEKDANRAINLIGQTGLLQFKTEQSAVNRDAILKKHLTDVKKEEFDQAKESVCADISFLQQFIKIYGEDPCFVGSELTGKYLSSADVNFNQTTNAPEVALKFTNEGATLFQTLTRANVKKKIGIFLDNLPLSAPTVQQEISGGSAVITGNFNVAYVKDMVNLLNGGALPAPIKLINQQTVGASLGEQSLRASLRAGIWGIIIVIIFMLIFYRLPGILASVALLIYTGLMLSIFRLLTATPWSITLTLAGIAGFILSIGMAVDANILIFERMREEFRWGRSFGGAVDEGFKRAWTSIRDSNSSSLITCIILYIFGTSVVRGFAVTLFIGIVVSMFSAITITRSFLRMFIGTRAEKWRWLFSMPKTEIKK